MSKELHKILMATRHPDFRTSYEEWVIRGKLQDFEDLGLIYLSRDLWNEIHTQIMGMAQKLHLPKNMINIQLDKWELELIVELLENAFIDYQDGGMPKEAIKVKAA